MKRGDIPCVARHSKVDGMNESDDRSKMMLRLFRACKVVNDFLFGQAKLHAILVDELVSAGRCDVNHVVIARCITRHSAVNFRGLL